MKGSAAADSPEEQHPQVSELDGKLQELHDTLSRLRRESDEKISKLRRESEDASRSVYYYAKDIFLKSFEAILQTL